VFVFSLERAAEHLLFDNGQLFAAGGGVVAVLQLLGSVRQGRRAARAPLSPCRIQPIDHLPPPCPQPQVESFSRGRVYSGHMAEGHPLLLDAAEAPTRSVIAGLATALGGVVPPQQRHCAASEDGVVEDWRWAVGAVPWGPYSGFSGMRCAPGAGANSAFAARRTCRTACALCAGRAATLHLASRSSIFATAAHRNLLLARLERPLRRLAAALDHLDAFVAQHLQVGCGKPGQAPRFRLAGPDRFWHAVAGPFRLPAAAQGGPRPRL
jgi:hypothetical protein